MKHRLLVFTFRLLLLLGLMAHTLGGSVAPAPQREFGHAVVRINEPEALFADVPSEIRVWASHGDLVAAAV